MIQSLALKQSHRRMSHISRRTFSCVRTTFRYDVSAAPTGTGVRARDFLPRAAATALELVRAQTISAFTAPRQTPQLCFSTAISRNTSSHLHHTPLSDPYLAILSAPYNNSHSWATRRLPFPDTPRTATFRPPVQHFLGLIRAPRR